MVQTQIHAIADEQFRAPGKPVIGTVINLPPDDYLKQVVNPAIEAAAPGARLVPLDPAVVAEHMGPGVGLHTHIPEHYVVRQHRGRAKMFLKREHAAASEGGSLVVYTREGFADDAVLNRRKDLAAGVVTAEDDYRLAMKWLKASTTHVLVTTLAYAGPRAPVDYETFVRNLAGANIDYEPSRVANIAIGLHQVAVEAGSAESAHNAYDDMRAGARYATQHFADMAAVTEAYFDKWCTVAD